MFNQSLLDMSHLLVQRCQESSLKITTAESCTGGLVSACLTEVAGSSSIFQQGLITYSNEAKISLLSVPEKLLVTVGAVSEEVAEAMALGVLTKVKSDISVAVTGIAGPGGGTNEKPVGLVYIAAARRSNVSSQYEPDHILKSVQKHFSGTRHEIRMKSVDTAIRLLLEIIPVD